MSLRESKRLAPDRARSLEHPIAYTTSGPNVMHLPKIEEGTTKAVCETPGSLYLSEYEAYKRKRGARFCTECLRVLRADH